MIDPGVLISDAIAAPAPGQWLLLFACTSGLTVTKIMVTCVYSGEIVTIKGAGGSGFFVALTPHLFQAKPAGMATDSSGQGTQQTFPRIQVHSWDNG